MAQFIFEAENLGQFMRVIEGLKALDRDVLVTEQNEINPFESDIRAKIQIEASFEEILVNLSTIKNSKTPLETIRPLQ